jgi:Capsule biosynthesis CapC
VLPIFPEGGLTSSVITTVWVGVFILAFFNLRFGWVLSGLVVPGYLVPLLILRPMAAGVIVVEAILTYWIVWLFSERLARGRFNALFGRDRFMGLVLASIAVRLTMDGWALPIAAEWLSNEWDRQIDWQSNLQSFGLVVISLMANQFWKPGLARGLLSAAVITGLSWLVVRYGLMELTNFRLSGVSYVYEGLASSILASPKAYIILVLTAFIASQMNLRYGWDFSGILIPALIALQWYQPLKILSSFLEAGIIYAIAHQVLKLPYFAGKTIEGARKLLLFFNVSFVYKLLLGHAIAWLALDVKITDFYAFGYLLSTLLAIKAYDKQIFPRVMRSTLEVSLAGTVAGNLIGFVLALVLPAQQAAVAAASAGNKGADSEALLVAAAGDAQLRAAGAAPFTIASADRRSLIDAIELLESGVRPELIAPGLARGSFRLTSGGNGEIAIARRSGPGRDLLLFNPAASRGLAVIVPDAAARPGLAAAGLTLFREQSARWLVVAGKPELGAKPDHGLDAALRAAVSVPELVVSVAPAATSPQLALSGNGATGIDLGLLRARLGRLGVTFASENPADRALLAVDEPALERLLAVEPLPDALPDCREGLVGAALGKRPDLAALAFLRFEIAEPLVAALAGNRAPGEVARRNALWAGHSLDRCLLDGAGQWRLTASGGSEGTFLFAPTGDRARLVQTSLEGPGLFDAAAAVQHSWNAGALLAAPHEDRLIGSQRSPFGVVSQVLLRSLGPVEGGIVQLRTPPGDAPALALTVDIAIVPDLVESESTWSPGMVQLARLAGYRPLLVERGKGTAGYELAPNLSTRYLNQSQHKRHATFWLVRQRLAPGEGQ